MNRISIFFINIFLLLVAYTVFDNAYLDDVFVGDNPDTIYKLDYTGKGLKEFPEEVFLYRNLRELCLGKNSITEVPNRIYQLDQLEVLDLAFNRIKELPNEISKLHRLKKLDLLCNCFDSIPKVICNLDSLVSLNLSCNDIQGYDNCIGSLNQLRDFRLCPEGKWKLTDEQRRSLIALLPNTNFGGCFAKGLFSVTERDSLEQDSLKYDLLRKLKDN